MEPGALVVAVLTHERTEDIEELLPLLLQQTETLEESGPRGSVLVVDNSPAGTARTVVERWTDPRVRYAHEPAPGIAHARNRALDEAARAGDDVLVFIDDDERPVGRWLHELVSTWRESSATAVAGVVVPEPGLIEDPWIVAGNFFVRQRHEHGAEVVAASTANLLLDLRRLEALGDLRFDPRFGTTGGSDTLYTRQLVSRGGQIVWCDRASVTDRIRPARLDRAWVLTRAFRSGNSWSRTEVELASGRLGRLRARLTLSSRGLVRLLGGTAQALAGRLVGSDARHARASRTRARGKGMLLGAWGVVYEEYRRAPQLPDASGTP